MRRTTAVLGTVAVLGLGIAAASPSNAGDSPLPLTESQMRQASMKLRDIPDSFSNDPQRSTEYEQGADAARFEICIDDNASKVFGKPPVQDMDATVMLKDSSDSMDNFKQRATRSDIEGYSSTKAAQKSWKKLVKATDRCAKKVTENTDVEGQPATAKIKQKVADLPRVGGAPGFSSPKR